MKKIQSAAFGVPEYDMKWEGAYRPRISPEHLRRLWKMKQESGKPIIILVTEALELYFKTQCLEVGYFVVLCLATMKKVDPKAPVGSGLLDEAVEAILEGIELMFSKQEKRFDKLEAGQRDLHRQIGDLKYDTPTQKEFDTLKGKVDKYHPLA